MAAQHAYLVALTKVELDRLVGALGASADHWEATARDRISADARAFLKDEAKANRDLIAALSNRWDEERVA